LAAEIEKRFDLLASNTGQTKAFYLRELIEQGLEDLEKLLFGCGCFRTCS
jgi:RHH-type rel operon transcriptional repressor/antitoxin RelB